MIAKQAWESLTPSQEQVAYEVGNGKTLEEISRESGVSRRTINKHLSEVYRKLRISGTIKKTTLAVLLWRSGLMNQRRLVRQCRK